MGNEEKSDDKTLITSREGFYKNKLDELFSTIDSEESSNREELAGNIPYEDMFRKVVGVLKEFEDSKPLVEGIEVDSLTKKEFNGDIDKENYFKEQIRDLLSKIDLAKSGNEKLSGKIIYETIFWEVLLTLKTCAAKYKQFGKKVADLYREAVECPYERPGGTIGQSYDYPEKDDPKGHDEFAE